MPRPDEIQARLLAVQDKLNTLPPGSPARLTQMPQPLDADLGADHLEARLLLILSMVNDWLRFAEGKNTNLVGLGSTGVSAVLVYLVSVRDPSHLLVGGLLLAGLIMVASLSVALLSFLPQTGLSRLLADMEGTPHPEDNFYYYGHLAKYSGAPGHLTSRIASVYFDLDDYEPARYRSHLDLATQITVNARIATAKYRLFTRSTVLFIAGVAVAVVTLLIVGLR